MDDVEQARRWVQDFADRFPEIIEAYLIGSRANGSATPDSDYDVILLVRGDGALSLSHFETFPSWESFWGWLQPDDARRLGFAPNAHVMLVNASSDEFRAWGFDFGTAPHVLLFRRTFEHGSGSG